jgi:phage tail-like protein
MADWALDTVTTPPEAFLYDDGPAEDQCIFGDSALYVNQSTISIYLQDSGAPSTIDEYAMINGVWQTGYSGTISSNDRGYDVAITTHPDWPGATTMTVTVTAQSLTGQALSDGWTFDVSVRATVVGARAIGRRKIEIEFDEAVIVRAQGSVPSEPADRYTPVDWSASDEAANPDNYTITRPSGGNLDGAGEAVDLVVTWAEEAEGYWSVSGGNIIATRVWAYTDFCHTARADYRVLVENLRCTPTGPVIDPNNDEADFAGYIASQVDRNSLELIETLPFIVRRMDDEGTGDLAKFFIAVQEVFERVLEDVDAFFPDLCEIDRARSEFLDNILYDLGDPISHLFDLSTNEKRKLISLLVPMYREKGTCEGIINAVNTFLGLTVTGCTAPWEATWKLHGGSYPSTDVPTGGPFELGKTTRLGPGTDLERWSFWVTAPPTPVFTSDQLAKIAAIVEYMKPAGSHYLGIKYV